MDSKVTRFVVCFCLLVLIGCSTLIAGGDTPKAQRVRADWGEVVIFNDGPKRIVVAMDTHREGIAADGLVDQWFVLQLTEPADISLPVHAAKAQVRYRAGALRVLIPATQTAYDFSLTDQHPQWSGGEGFTIVSAQGYGLSANVGDTTMSVTAPVQATGRRITTQDDSCGVCDPFVDDPAAGGGGSSTCDAGGRFSSQCSITNGSRSCEVTCTSPNTTYACCQITTTGVRCSCKLYT